MLAGLSCKVASLVILAARCAEFAFHIYSSARTPGHPYGKGAPPLPPSSAGTAKPPSYIRSGAPPTINLPQTRLFRAFLVSFGLVTLTIFIHSCFRVAELSGGFHVPLANNQVSFMVLEGGMVAIACLALIILHLGVCLQGDWRAVDFRLGKQTAFSRRV